MDLEERVVIDVQLVQSDQVRGSYHIEKKGLRRSVVYLKGQGVEIKGIVTDRHLQIGKWIRENMPDTTHCYDVWHVAKGLKMKLVALANEKECSELRPWIKNITNHLYWAAASTPEQEGKRILSKWSSLTNHIINIYEGHTGPFDKCLHGDFSTDHERKRWLQQGSKVYEKLQTILTSRQMTKDVQRLSTGQQTSCLEGYHSVVNHFAPKMIGFSYHGMLCRLWLAALNYNENCQLAQAVKKDGTRRNRIVFPKYKVGGHTLRRIPTDSTYDYARCLMRTSFRLAEVFKMKHPGLPLAVEVTPPLCSQYERPSIKEALQAAQTRFNLSHRHEESPGNPDYCPGTSSQWQERHTKKLQFGPPFQDIASISGQTVCRLCIAYACK